MVSSFPLLCLPTNAQHHVLCNLSHTQLILFSLLSERTKNLVKSLELKSIYFSVRMGQHIYMTVHRTNKVPLRMAFYTNSFGDRFNARNGYPPMKFETCGFVQGIYFGEEQNAPERFEKRGFTFRDWIDQTLFVFNQSKIDSISFDRSIDQFETDSLYKTIKGLDVEALRFDNIEPRANTEMIVKLLYPFKSLATHVNPFKHSNSICTVITQNFDTLTLGDTCKLKLNDLLVCNSVHIHIQYTKALSDRDLNQFLKHWIHGSNPRMKYLCLSLGTNRIIDNDVVFRGVDNQAVSDEKERTFITSCCDFINFYFNRKIKGGIDIKRNNGIPATILFEQLYGIFTIEMVVWQ